MRQDLRPFTACFTGHRELLQRDIPARLDELLSELIKQGYRYFGAGGALGFDTEAALAVLRARGLHPHVKLILVLPYPGQTERWNAEQQREYERIKGLANKVKYTGERYSSDCYHKRNRALVEGASLCIAYKYKDNGGTAYTCSYAREQGIRIINIAEGVL